MAKKKPKKKKKPERKFERLDLTITSPNNGDVLKKSFTAAGTYDSTVSPTSVLCTLVFASGGGSPATKAYEVMATLIPARGVWLASFVVDDADDDTWNLIVTQTFPPPSPTSTPAPPKTQLVSALTLAATPKVTIECPSPGATTAKPFAAHGMYDSTAYDHVTVMYRGSDSSNTKDAKLTKLDTMQIWYLEAIDVTGDYVELVVTAMKDGTTDPPPVTTSAGGIKAFDETDDPGPIH
jgi:hypothetical protein